MDELYLKSKGWQTRWASFENPKGEKGQGGMENNGGKGRAFRPIEPGQSHVLMEAEGSGTVDRIWITLNQVLKSPEALQGLRIAMYWDHSETPAVSAPLGDFFGAAMGLERRFESVFLSNPEGRSFNSFFKMPFLTGARIVLTNESAVSFPNLFYDVCYTLRPIDPENILYFHAYWNREKSVLRKDYTVLPRLEGEGKFLGMSVGVKANPQYGTYWFGEGEVKIYLDGDGDYPTLCGTGTEDYIGTAWGQGEFSNRTQGCLVADPEGGLFTFYRFHEPDPICFYRDIAVDLQTIGGADKHGLLKLLDNGAPAEIVTRDSSPGFEHLLDTGFVLDRSSPEGWYNHYRKGDEFTSTAYFYYDKPVSGLPEPPKAAQ